MKKFIYKTNQYLLEKFPILWNTKLVWVLIIAIVLHVLFFLFGYNALSNPEVLHEHNASSIFFKNGTVFINIIISILLIVIWLIYLFKNNAFKSFYPTSRLNLFKQFISYLIIIFSLTTFFISYNAGLKTYIKLTYDDESISKEIEVVNDAALFFSNDIKDYTINNRRYPKPLNELYCQSYLLRGGVIDSAKMSTNTLPTKLSFLDFEYTFYTLKEEKEIKNQYFNTNNYEGYVFYKTRDTVRTYFYTDSIYDVSNIIKSAYPSYYNYSKTFFIAKDTLQNSDDINFYYGNYEEYNYNYAGYNYFNKRNESRSKRNQELLNRNNPEEIKQLLQTFITITNSYKIDHNLSSEKWFNLVYNPTEFNVLNLIRQEKKQEYKFNLSPENTTPFDVFHEKHITDYYIETDALHNVYENIEDIKADETILESIHFYIWFSFLFSALVFMFRVTGLKSLIFTIIAIGVLSLLVGLLSVLYGYITGFYGNSPQYFLSYLSLFLGIIILSIPIFFLKQIKKTIISICLNISIIGFIPFIFLIISIISLHQSEFCFNYVTSLHYQKCTTLLNSLGIYWSYILFIISLIFIYVYTGIIKNWKALPEG